MRWAIVGVLLVAGCATTKEAGVGVWESDTLYGHVEVWQRRGPDGRCLERRVTFRREAGLFIDGRPTYVRAVDTGCDDTFDMWVFRSVEEEMRADRRDLSQLLLHLMYATIPIHEHPRGL